MRSYFKLLLSPFQVLIYVIYNQVYRASKLSDKVWHKCHNKSKNNVINNEAKINKKSVNRENVCGF